MCGIIGLFIKEQAHQSRLGEWFEPMLLAMAERGPDSAGNASAMEAQSPTHL